MIDFVYFALYHFENPSYEYVKTVAIINSIVAAVGISLNCFHFAVLCKKNLRSDAIFYYIRVVAVSDVILHCSLILSEWNSFTYLFGGGYCEGYTSLSVLLQDILSIYLIETSFITTEWLICIFGVYKMLAVKRSDSFWIKDLISLNSAKLTSLITVLAVMILVAIKSLYRYNIQLKPDDFPCVLRPNTIQVEREQYGFLHSAEFTAIYDTFGSLKLCQEVILPIAYVTTTFSLKSALKKIVDTQEIDEKNAATIRLVLYFNLSYLASLIPTCILDFLRGFISTSYPQHM